MTDKNKTEIAVILDRSGSMHNIRQDMIGGFDAFIDEQRREPGELRVSLYQFDDKFEVVYQGKPAHEVGKLELMPRGNTALLDAVGKATVMFGERLNAMPEDERPGAVIVMVITDGQENASKEYTKGQVQTLIRKQEEQYNWKYLYLGADAAGFAEAHDQGFARAANFSLSGKGVRDMYDGTSNSVRSYRSAVSRGVKGADLQTPDLKPSSGKA